MRVAFGLVGLLVTIAVIVWIMHEIYLPDIQASQAVQQKAQTFVDTLNAQDENGVPITEMYSVYADMRDDGKLQDLQITKVVPGSVFQTRFGVMPNDVVVAAIDSHLVRTDLNGLDDEQAGKDAIRDAYTGDGGQLVVIRNSQTITLPLAKTAPPAAPANVTAQNQPANQPAPSQPLTAQQQQTAQQTEKQQEGKSNDGSENGTMDELHQRLHALPTY
jgi:hypothetical protein